MYLTVFWWSIQCSAVVHTELLYVDPSQRPLSLGTTIFNQTLLYSSPVWSTELCSAWYDLLCCILARCDLLNHILARCDLLIHILARCDLLQASVGKYFRLQTLKSCPIFQSLINANSPINLTDIIYLNHHISEIEYCLMLYWKGAVHISHQLLV